MNWQKLAPLFILIGILGVGAGGYFYYQYRQNQNNVAGVTSDPAQAQKAAQAELKKIEGEIGKLIALPEGEEPTLATVTDIDKLKDQPFFANARNGDKVLIYTNARKAILYDPDAKKIIDVAPINIGSQSAQAATSAKIVLRNGTTTVGLTTKVEADIKKSFPDADVVNKENAAKSDYTKTLVIVLNDNAKDAASKLANSLNASVSSLPAGETKPSGADILVILGKDRT